MKKIIVPTDFSEAALNAARYALAIAAQIDASITLLHVLPLLLPVSEIPVPPQSFTIIKAEAEQRLQQLCATLKEEGQGKIALDYYWTDSSFTDELKTINRQKDVYAVVMGTTGSRGTAALFLGSYSLAALKKLKHPLIVVPPGYRYQPVKKVALACDMEDVTATIPLSSVCDLLKIYDASVAIIYVSDHGEGISTEAIRESRFVKTLLPDNKPSVQMLAGYDIEMELENYIRANNIDLLMMTRKDRGPLEQLFHTSLTKKMLLHPSVPILILHH